MPEAVILIKVEVKESPATIGRNGGSKVIAFQADDHATLTNKIQLFMKGVANAYQEVEEENGESQETEEENTGD